MEPTNTFSQGLLDNQNQFKGEFFSKLKLRHAPKPLKLNDSISKNYLFPTLYTDVTMAVGIFYCSYEKAKAVLPDSKLKPLSMGQGRSLLILSSYQYNQVLGIPPYNEIGVTIPVVYDTAFNPPVLPLLFGDPFRLGYFVYSMPVTSLENEIRGHKIWGLPKVLQDISFSTVGGDYLTVAKEKSGEVYLQFRVPLTGAEKKIEQTTNLYSKLDGNLLRSTSKNQGKFAVTKFPTTLLRKGAAAAKPYLTLGDSPSALALKKLEIEPQPMQLRFSSHVSSFFDLPDPDFK